MQLTDRGDGTALLRIAPGSADRGDHAIRIVARDTADAFLQPFFGEQLFVVSVDVPNAAPSWPTSAILWP